MRGAALAPEWYRALHLAERGVPHGKTADDRAAAAATLEPWQRNPVFRDDESQLVARLRIDHRTVADIDALLSETARELRARSPALPSDLARAARAIESARKDDDATHALVSDLVESAFSRACLRLAEPLLTPALRTLREGLGERLNGSAVLANRTNDAVRAWVKALSARIDPLFMRTLALEVNIARIDGTLTGETGEQRFVDFIRRLAQPRARRSFFRRYPVLARQLQSRIDHWVAFGLDFFAHLARDAQDIRRAFACDPGVPVSIDAGAADAHRDGRSVLLLAFAGGGKLVYKPRGLSLDVHFQELLAWLNERRAVTSPALRTLRILDRADHGWCEFVEAHPCDSEAELERFYWRQGAYLALLYALEATDFHSENVIASGEHPMLVDLEGLFSPRRPEIAARWARDPAIHAWLNGVMRIGLLPLRTYTNEAEEGIDVTGLGHRPGQMAPRLPLMKGLGTDEMHVEYERVPLDVQPSVPRLRDQYVDISSHLETVVAGFRATYLLLSTRGDELRNGPLASFRDDECRVLLLATWIYDRTLHTSFHPQCLGDALERDPILDQIWRTPEVGEKYQRVFQAERAELLNGDIPYFRTRVDGHDVISGHGDRFDSFFQRSGYQGATDRIARFGDADLDRQVWSIRAAFAAMPLGKAEHTWRSHGGNLGPRLARPAPLLPMAEAIGRRLVTLAINRDGRAGWLGVSLVNGREWRLLPASSDLYNGASGIALFLAYLAHFTRDSACRRLAREALATALEYVAWFQRTPDQVVTVGPWTGMSGTVFLLAHLGSLWREPALLDRGEEVVELLGTRIEADRHFDLLDGTAGFLSALLALYQVRRAPSVLDLARRCANHLVRHAVRRDDLVGCHWPSRHPAIAPLTGIAHGNSGIALSLHRAWLSTGDETYRTAAADAIAYERSVFCADAGNWPDFRAPASTDRKAPRPERQRFMVAWCHGAPGIGLSRVAMLEDGDDPELRLEIDAAITTTLARGFGKNHSLCHGDLGNIDLLIAQPDRDALREDVARVTAMIAQTIRDHGWITGVPFGVESPGLMAGLAGTGYGLLRLFAPSDVPSVLLLEPPAGS